MGHVAWVAEEVNGDQVTIKKNTTIMRDKGLRNAHKRSFPLRVRCLVISTLRPRTQGLNWKFYQLFYQSW